eukprot:CAMPEP_0184495850 /NCGR_PEP_ID=MMETSP0113_2-20130426/32503_1 /TAXON_ID=91329 /ORGANISM="Norrisiella sphaerica, Strain BC52" /LENGTH=116 /DNA_ID=CAMNT_0026882227 /DNA_START=1 /DNA_END=351 /DNA_ORIENTATION=+
MEAKARGAVFVPTPAPTPFMMQNQEPKEYPFSVEEREIAREKARERKEAERKRFEERKRRREEGEKKGEAGVFGSTRRNHLPQSKARHGARGGDGKFRQKGRSRHGDGDGVARGAN